MDWKDAVKGDEFQNTFKRQTAKKFGERPVRLMGKGQKLTNDHWSSQPWKELWWYGN